MEKTKSRWKILIYNQYKQQQKMNFLSTCWTTKIITLLKWIIWKVNLIYNQLVKQLKVSVLPEVIETSGCSWYFGC